MLLSIIVPVYNVEEYIKECIDSILRQSIQDFEIIVVDDGSKDNSIDIVKKIGDKRIKILTKENGGLSSARNFGLKVATGKYVVFIDSDDFIILDNCYEEMINIIEKNKSNLVHGDAIKYYSKENNCIFNKISEIESFKSNNMKSEDFFLACIKEKIVYAPVWLNLYNREFLIKNDLYFKEGIYHEDEDFTPRVLLAAKNISIYKKAFYAYRQREGSIMSKENDPIKGRDLIDIAEGLSIYIEKITRKELKDSFGIYISSMIIGQVYKYRFKQVSPNLLKIIRKNSKSSGLKVRAIIMNINISLYFVIENMYRRLRRIND